MRKDDGQIVKQLLWLFSLGLLIGMLAGKAHAQLDPTCNVSQTNPTNSGANVTVDNTSTGVSVLAAMTRGVSCAAMLRNVGAADANCASADDVVVDATHGTLIHAGDTLVLGYESYHNWKCFRTTANSTSFNITRLAKGPR